MPQLLGHGCHAPWALWPVLALLGLWSNQENIKRTKIEPDSPVDVLFSPRERDLAIEETFAGPNLTKRLRLATVAGEKIVVRYTLGDLDELAGFIAAVANYADGVGLQDELDGLFDRLRDEMESCDGGGGRSGAAVAEAAGIGGRCAGRSRVSRKPGTGLDYAQDVDC